MSHPRLLFGDSDHCPDILYATGHHIPDPFLWFEIDGQASLILSPLEVARARAALAGRARVLSFADAKEQFGAGRSTYSQIFALSCHFGIRSWQVQEAFPLPLARRLQQHGISTWCAQGAFFPERATKTEAEIEHLREGVQLAQTGMYTAFEVLREAKIAGDAVMWRGQPLTADILRGEINASIARQGGLANHTIVAPGRYGADPHSEGAGPILPHQPIVIDIFPRVVRTGYFGDLTRTVVKGQPAEIVARAFAAVQAARDWAIGQIQHGIVASDVHNGVSASLEKAGFPTDTEAAVPSGFFHGTGHGLGLEIHEAPRLSRATNVLETGNVVTVEPGLYYPAWGGVRLEDVVVVEPQGCTNLTSIPTFLTID